MPDAMVRDTQQWLNTTYGGHAQWRRVSEDGFTGWGTMFALIRGLQIELGITSLSDNFGSGTASAFTSQIGSVSSTTTNRNVIRLTQGALWCKGYLGGYTWFSYDAVVTSSVQKVTADMGLIASSSVSVKVLKSLMSMDAYVLLAGGTEEKRAVQRWLNGKYSHRSAFNILPCDGLFSRNTQQGIMYAIQYELNMTDSVANGNFGPSTKSGLRSNGNVSQGSTDTTKNWVRLFQGSLRLNGYSSPFSGTFDPSTRGATISFQQYAELPTHGSGDYRTWASLLISTGDETRPGMASDMATQLNAGLCVELYKAGYRTVGRYLTVKSKRYLPGELQAIFDAGLETFPILQEDGTSLGYFNKEIGQGHAQQAARRLRQLGFPAGTTVFFAVDFDATDDTISAAIIPYFQGVREYLSRTRVAFKVGIYGTRNVCTRVINAGFADEAFIASMSWGWSGNLGYALPPKWSYDQIYNYALSGTSAHTANGKEMEIDKNVQSSRANPVGKLEILPTPLPYGGFDRFYWMITHLVVLAEITGAGFPVDLQTNTVLYYVQIKDSKYLADQFKLYLLEPTQQPQIAFYRSFPQWATDEESVVNETDFVSSFPVLGGTSAGTSHLAVTARGYMRYGRPTMSERTKATIADLGGWALDLASMWTEFTQDSSVAHPASSSATKAWYKRRIGVRDLNPDTQGYFSFDDLIGDIDGYIVGSLLSDDVSRRLDDVLREIRTKIVADVNWRYTAFYSQRFGSTWANAKAAAVDVFTSGNFTISGPVTFTMGGFDFLISRSQYGKPVYQPTAIHANAIGEAWADLVSGLAQSGASAAPQ